MDSFPGLWRAFKVGIKDVVGDVTHRLDLKYWDPSLREPICKLIAKGAPNLASLATEEIRRGSSPPADTYVEEANGYALVVKAGTNISRFGKVLKTGDFIEKNTFEDEANATLKDGDVLLSSTGTGTLGKCAVFRGDYPAIADGHVTIIRVDANKVYPEFLCDYPGLFGAMSPQPPSCVRTRDATRSATEGLVCVHGMTPSAARSESLKPVSSETKSVENAARAASPALPRVGAGRAACH